MIKIFVYGTLMRNGYNHNAYLVGKKYCGAAILNGYAMFNLGSFPGIVAHPGERIKGEVYEIDRSTLGKLDVLEGNGYFYTREVVGVQRDDGSAIDAWSYIWNGQVNHDKKIKFESQPWTEKDYARRYVS